MVTIAAGTTLDLSTGNTIGTQPIVFGGTNAVLKIAMTSGTLPNEISNLQAGDTLVVTGLQSSLSAFDLSDPVQPPSGGYTGASAQLGPLWIYESRATIEIEETGFAIPGQSGPVKSFRLNVLGIDEGTFSNDWYAPPNDFPIGVGPSSLGGNINTFKISGYMPGSVVNQIEAIDEPNGNATDFVNVAHILAAPSLSATSGNLVARTGDASSTFNVVVTNLITNSAMSDLLQISGGGGSQEIQGYWSFGKSRIGSLIRPGQSDNLTFSLNTGTAGVFSITDPLSVVSEGGINEALVNYLPSSSTISVAGTVFGKAAAYFPSSIAFPIVHVGDAAQEVIQIRNTTTGATTDFLLGSVSAVSSGFHVSGSLDVAGGSSGTLAVSMDTGTAGTLSGTIALALASHDAILSDVSLPTPPITINGQVNNYATAFLLLSSGSGKWTGTNTDHTLDLGILPVGSPLPVITISPENVADGLADQINGSYEFIGSAGFLNSGFAAVSGLAAGHTGPTSSVELETSQIGVYSETIFFNSTGSNISGYSAPLVQQEVVIRGTVAAEPPPPTNLVGIPDCFTGNGTSDVLFENNNSGLILYWQIQNDAVQQGVPLTTASPGWNLIGTGDFTGDGTSDILFENSQSGLVIYWDMQNGHVDHGVALTTASTGWGLIGTGDFTGNGTDDLLFQNSQSGLIVYWQMQNGQLAQGVALTTATFDWQFLGVGDFAGNGTDNLLFRNSQSGLVVDWVLQNGHLDHGVALTTVALDWQFAGIGDFYGNGTDDVLWENKNSGLVVDWKMSNGALQTGVSVGTLPSGYQVAAVGKYSGTSTSDILLHNAATGAYAEWKMANGVVSGNAIPLGNAASDWKVMG